MKLKTISDRVSDLETALKQHLEESGVIRTDLAWLKKSYWTLVGVISAVGSAIVIKLFHA